MLAKRIIPCLDVHAGRVVKGTKFLNLVDAGDPVELAQRYNVEGADELVFLDITASAEKRGILLKVVERTAEQVFIPLVFRGTQIGRSFCDFLIEDKIILEIKRGDRFSRQDIQQVFTYLRGKNLKLGILARFSKDGLKIKRVVNLH